MSYHWRDDGVGWCPCDEDQDAPGAVTAVPPRPAATQTDCRRTGPLTWCNHPSYACKRGECYLAEHLTAPDATAGDGLREAELVARLAEAIQDHRDAATGPTTAEQDYRPGAPCRSCGSYPGPLHQRSDCPRAVASALLPALRDVLAAAARDAEKVRRVEALAMDLERCAPRELHPVRETAIHLRAALDPS